MGKKKNKQLKKQLQGSIPAGMTVEELLASAAGGKKSKGLLGAIQNNTSNQFLLGALLGATAAYVLSSDEMREKIVRSAVKLYTDIAGGMEELKEQVADIQAEMAVQTGDDEQ